jgi:hypothetical protein
MNFKIESEIIMLMTEKKPEKRPSAREFINSEIMKHWQLDVKY